MEELFNLQLSKLQECHFLILYWAALAEDKGVKYNMTNIFDDLKAQKLTRTKQSAVAYVETLNTLYFIRLKDESNRKNVYITDYGATALAELGKSGKYKVKKSLFIEGIR